MAQFVVSLVLNSNQIQTFKTLSKLNAMKIA